MLLLTATGFSNNEWRDPGFKQAPDHPVVNVSWNDANEFCLWLTGKEHHDGILAANETYRLPTDLEWSNAVGLPPETGRTPESRDIDIPDVYPWGTQWPPPAGAGNYTGEETDSDVAIKGYNDGFAWTSPVGSFNANKFGLYDMGGNVWEWCGDWWNSEQKAKVLRGGSWYNGALKLSLLSSCRVPGGPDDRNDTYGFRVVLAQEATKPKRRAEQKPSPAPGQGPTDFRAVMEPLATVMVFRVATPSQLCLETGVRPTQLMIRSMKNILLGIVLASAGLLISQQARAQDDYFRDLESPREIAPVVQLNPRAG